ncbi:hypothetical protein ACO2I3_08030 [Leptospira interrogans]
MKAPDVVLRRFDEWGHCYVFTPDESEIYDLNTSAWLIVELCDGRPFEQIESEYLAVVGPKVGRDRAREQFHAGFDALLERNIITAS